MNSQIAHAQYKLNHQDLALVLALSRGRSLARAAELLGVDGSTIFRAIRKLERALGNALFDKGRAGYLPTDLALALARQAEQAEQALAVAHRVLDGDRQAISGNVRITCTDTVLHGLLLPALPRFMSNYPLLGLEFATSSEFANLSRHDADLALRLTTSPPPHLIGREVGPVPYVLCAPAAWRTVPSLTDAPWIAPDDFLPDHATVAWRRQHLPGVVPRYRCNSLVSVCRLIETGLGVGAVPQFLAQGHPALRIVGDPLPGCTTALWMLTRPDCRSRRTVSAMFEELGRHLNLPPNKSAAI